MFLSRFRTQFKIGEFSRSLYQKTGQDSKTQGKKKIGKGKKSVKERETQISWCMLVIPTCGG